MTRGTTRRFALVACSGAFLVSAMQQTACTQAAADVAGGAPGRATAAVVDRTSASTSMLLEWADGTYGSGCAGRSGRWSLRIAGDATMDNPPLSVVANDPTCVLTITSIHAGQSYEAIPPIQMGASAAGSVASFVGPDGRSISFYATADLSCAEAECVVSVILADRPDNLADGGEAGDLGDAGQAVSLSAMPNATGIASPDYALDLIAGAFSYEVDVNNLVQSVSGYVDLDAGNVTGSGYVVDMGALPPRPTFAQLDRAYAASTPVVITDADPHVPASAFKLVGVTLTSPVVRTVVIQRVVSGVRAYQALSLTFGGS